MIQFKSGVFFLILTWLSVSAAAPAGPCINVAEQAAMIELGQDMNYLSAEASLIPQEKSGLSSGEVLYSVIVTEEDAGSYLYYVAMETATCKVLGIDSIPFGLD